MNINSTVILPQIEQLMHDYKRYLRYATDVKRDFVYNTFIEKLIKLLGWDPWRQDEYQLFTLNVGQEVFYGARLFVPNNKSIVVVHIDEAKLYDPQYLIKQNLDMSFYVHLAFMAIDEKFSKDDIQLVWFTSILKNYLYNYDDKSPHSFFTGSYEQFEKLQRAQITKQYGHQQLEGRSSDPGLKLAVWLYNWQTRLGKEAREQCVQDLVDYLIAITMLNRADISLRHDDDQQPVPEKLLFENLLIKYQLSQVKEFLLEVDFNQIIPKIYDNYRKRHNFQLYPCVEELPHLDNKMFAQLIEEVVSLSEQSLSYKSLAHAYHILADEEVVAKLSKNTSLPDWSLPHPVLTRRVDISNKQADTLTETVLHIDGDDIGLVLSVYDVIEQMYVSVNNDVSRSKKVRYELFDNDLFERRQVERDMPDIVDNIPAHIIEHNIRIVMPEPSKKRAITMLLIKKSIDAMKNYSPSRIVFPPSIKFVR